MLLREIIIARLAQPGHKPHRRVLDMCDLLAGTGLRIGEALALRWMDVDLTDDVGTINIRGTIVNRQQVVRQSYPKSESSKAVIALPSYLIDRLQEMYELAGKPSPEKPVFASRTGKFLPPSAIRISLRRIQEDSKVKLPKILTPHSLRRMVATHIADTQGMEAAAMQLRHRRVETTRRHYVDRPEKVRSQAEALSIFAPRTESSTE